MTYQVSTNMTQEEAYNVVKEMEDRAYALLRSAKDIAQAYDIPATMVFASDDALPSFPVKVVDGQLVIGRQH
jgi:hypothetical protein